jgi:antitoxin PrlF
MAAGERIGPQAFAAFGTMALEPLQTTLIVNPRGGLTIPRAMRSALALDPGGSLIAQLTPEGVLLRPAITFPLSESDARQVRAALAVEADLDRFLRKRKRRTLT